MEKPRSPETPSAPRVICLQKVWAFVFFGSHTVSGALESFVLFRKTLPILDTPYYETAAAT